MRVSFRTLDVESLVSAPDIFEDSCFGSGPEFIDGADALMWLWKTSQVLHFEGFRGDNVVH